MYAIVDIETTGHSSKITDCKRVEKAINSLKFQSETLLLKKQDKQITKLHSF